MPSNKLFTLFQSLTDSDLRALKQFVRSPFHNQRQDVVLLFDALRAACFSKLTEEDLYRVVYPDSPFNKKALAYVMNYLMQAIEDYFAVAALQKQKAKRELWIARAALEHGQKNIFKQKIKKAKKIIEGQALDNLEAQHLKYQLEMELYNLKKNEARGADMDLKKPTAHLDVFLIGAKLRQGCLLLAHQNVLKVDYEHDLLEALLQYLEAPERQHLLGLPVIALYHHSYKALKEEKAIYFEQLKTGLAKHRDCFTLSELKDFHAIGLNFCIKQINKGKSEYVRELFEWYRQALQEGLLLEHGVLSPVHYKNIAASGLGLKEFEWVASFLQEYKSRIEPKHRELNFNYNMAKLYYEKGDFGQAMQLLQVVKYDDSLPNLTSKILLMKIYYELEEFTALESYLRSFEGSVRRQRKLGYHKENYLNLTSLMYKLLKLNKFDKSAVQKLRSVILNTQTLPEKKWLLSRIAELV